MKDRNLGRLMFGTRNLGLPSRDPLLGPLGPAGSVVTTPTTRTMELTDFPNLEFWIDRELSTLTKTDTAVSAVSDLSGHGRNATQDTGDYQPTSDGTFNGRDAFYFNQDHLEVSGLPTTGTFNYFVVGRHTESAGSASLIGGSGSNTTRIPEARKNDSADIYVRVNGTINPSGLSLRLNGQSSQTVVNRDDVFDDLNAGGVMAFINSPAVDGEQTYIGTSSSFTFSFLIGDITQVAIVSGTLTQTEIDQITAIMAHRDGVELVDGHPYKDAPPTIEV